MGIYYLSRGSIVTALIICIWLVANIFINVPPDFNKYQGDVIHKELVKSDTTRYSDGRIAHISNWYNFTYLTKSGHSVNVKNYEYEHNDHNYAKFNDENQFYVTSGWTIIIFVLLCVYGFFGSLITLACDGIDDIEQMIYGDQTVKIHARNMRFKHYKILSDLFGYSDEETRQLTYQAIEMAQNNSDYLHSLECGWTIRVPHLTNIDEMVENNIKKLIKDKQREINNG
jgi:hypothetical protein